MHADRSIGPYRALAPIDGDHWRVRGPAGEAVARAVPGPPAADFEATAARLVALRDPHIWPALAAARVDGRGWVVRPPVEGGTLADRLAAGHRPPYKIAIDVGVAVLRGLASAHGAGFVHGALDAAAVGFAEGRVQLIGIGDAALVGRSPAAADDLRAVSRLLQTLVPDPPGELRALLAAPLPTAEAFCRALKTLDPALGHDRDFDFSTPAPAGPTPIPPAAPARPTPPPDEPPPRRPPPAEDSWGVAPPADEAPPPSAGKGWVVGAREMVEASSVGEDTWGVSVSDAPPVPQGPALGGMRRDHTGAVVHTVQSARQAPTEAAARSPLATVAVAIAVIAVVLVGARVAMNQLADEEALPEPSVPAALRTEPPIEPAPTADPIVDDTADATTAIADATPDATAADADLRPRVELAIEPVPGKVVRVADGAVICEASTACPVPIDVDYRVTAKGYQPRDISGDDLYDRRRIGRLRLVLQPVAPPEPAERRRRRQ